MSNDHYKPDDGIDPRRRGLLKTVGVAAIGGTGSFSGITAGETATRAGSQFGTTNGEWVEQAKLTAGDDNGENRFGRTVAIDGNTALIGSDRSTHVFTRSDGIWSGGPKLPAGNVALDGSTALIGDPGPESTHVYTQVNGTWHKQAELIPSDGPDSPTDLFGWAVAVEGDTALIGRPGEFGARNETYVFTRSDGIWSEEQILNPRDLTGEPEFGSEISLNGDISLIGAPGDEYHAGAAYVFTRSNGEWSKQAKLTLPEYDSSYRFGTAVAIDGDTALIGADRDATSAGSAFVYTRSGGAWSERTRLIPSDNNEQDYFGFAVALAGDIALIGASGDEDPNGESAGSVYVYTCSNGSWTEETKLSASDGDSDDRFGEQVVLEGDAALIGAPGDEGPNEESTGSAYVFDRSASERPPDVNGDGNVARDLDGDGLYEDVNGDGDANVGDAQALFNSRDSDPVQDHPELFDFNNDRSLNVGDAQALFDEVTEE